MKEKLTAALTALNLKDSEKHITVALSGGKDSIALLFGLLEVKQEFGLTVSAAHFNHLLRGEEAFRDEDFVKALCKKLNIDLFTERADVNAFAKKEKIGIEEAARQLRYDFFKRVNKGCIATAHTASDNLETLLLHILRGSGLDGLCSIPQRRGIFIRPLLSVTSEETESYCKENGFEFVTDSTNLVDVYSRNFLRLKVIPLLKRLNPSLDTASSRLIESLKLDRDFIDQQVEKEYTGRKREAGLYVGNLGDLHSALISRLIICFLKENCIEVSSLRVAQIISGINEEKTKISVGKDKFVYIKDCILFCEQKKEATCRYEVNLEKKSADYLYKNGKINNLLLKNTIDCDKIDGILTVRTKREGDKITLSHRRVTKTLKKLFSEDALPIEMRKTIPVIADEKGIVWVYSYGVDKRVCPDASTKTVFAVDCKKIQDK